MDRPDERLVAEFTHQAESFNKSPVMNMQQTTGSLIALLPLTLHHMPEPGRCVAEMARVVRPGGWVAVASARPTTPVSPCSRVPRAAACS